VGTLRKSSAARLGIVCFGLSISAAFAAVPGRDFVPSDWATEGSIEIDGAASDVLVDAIAVGRDLWVVYIDSGSGGTLLAAKFDPSAAALGAPVTVLAPDTTAGSPEAHGLGSGQVAACSTTHVFADTLTWDGRRYRTSHLGIVPTSVAVTGSGGACATVAPRARSFTPGFEDGGAYTLDGFALDGAGTCTSFTASYDYTTCGFSSADAYRCAVVPDPVRDGDAELGACRFLLVYEAQADLDGDSATVDDRSLLTAHAANIAGPWVRYLPSGGTHPVAADIRVLDTALHGGDPGPNLHSFVSVPTLYYDVNDQLWRMWFVTEEPGRPSIRYTESDDQGQSWGIGGGSGGTIDCWNGGGFDRAACAEIAWTGNLPPDDLNPGSTRSPDSVDPEIVRGEFDGRPGQDMGMMFTGGDDGCSNGDWGVLLWQQHPDSGDQAGGRGWRWVTSVAADGVDGVVMDRDAAGCAKTAPVMDPEIVKYGAGYLMFVNSQGGIHVAASGYACSDFRDDDGDAAVDWPDDADCSSPWDASE